MSYTQTELEHYLRLAPDMPHYVVSARVRYAVEVCLLDISQCVPGIAAQTADPWLDVDYARARN